MTFKRSLIFLFLLCVVKVFALADIADDISGALKSGNTKEISKYFNTNVSLTIGKTVLEDNYSKVQAEQILTEFFSKNTPKVFNILQKGGSRDGSKYAIGLMETKQGALFRTYFVIKNVSGQNYIVELRLEETDEE